MFREHEYSILFDILLAILTLLFVILMAIPAFYYIDKWIHWWFPA